MEWIFDPWPWYVSGPMITLVMVLLLLSGKNFGMSSNLRTVCSLCGAHHKIDFFRFDWKAQRWNLLVALGAVGGGYIAANFLSADLSVAISEQTIAELKALGFDSAGERYLPSRLFDTATLSNPTNMIILLSGGFLIGFGARYAGGCTSGHAISGLSNLQWPSFIAVIGFFIGGLIMTHLLFPLIFS